MTLEGVDDVEGGDGLSLGVLGVGDGVTDDVLEENLQDTTGLFVDQTRDTLDTTSSSQSTDGWLGDPLDVVPQDLSVTLGAAFAESFTSFTTSRHVVCICELLFLARLTGFKNGSVPIFQPSLCYFSGPIFQPSLGYFSLLDFDCVLDGDFGVAF